MKLVNDRGFWLINPMLIGLVAGVLATVGPVWAVLSVAGITLCLIASERLIYWQRRKIEALESRHYCPCRVCRSSSQEDRRRIRSYDDEADRTWAANPHEGMKLFGLPCWHGHFGGCEDCEYVPLGPPDANGDGPHA